MTVTEYDEGMVTVDLPVTLSGPSSQTVSADWQTADGQAVAPADFVASYGSVIFEPGETQKTVSVTIVGDKLDEPDEVRARLVPERPPTRGWGASSASASSSSSTMRRRPTSDRGWGRSSRVTMDP